MKAKEYAARIIAADYAQESVKQVFNDLVYEIQKIAENRKIATNRALRAIILEQNQKWKAVCRIVNKDDHVHLTEDGFMNLLKVAIPETESILLEG